MNTRFLHRRMAGVLAGLIVASCFAGVSLVRAAEPAAPACPCATKEDALTAAHEARRQGDFRLAAQCYRLADEPVLADRALAEGFVQASASAGQGMSETIATAKQQARAIRESLRRR
jgi:hypothetical protein